MSLYFCETYSTLSQKPIRPINFAGQVLSLPGFFYCFLDDLSGPAAALIVAVGVHFQRDALVTVPQDLAHRGHVRPGGDRKGGESVAEFVRVESLNVVPLCELPEIVGWTGWVHWLWTPVLGENKGADGLLRLLASELAE